MIRTFERRKWRESCRFQTFWQIWQQRAVQLGHSSHRSLPFLSGTRAICPWIRLWPKYFHFLHLFKKWFQSVEETAPLKNHFDPFELNLRNFKLTTGFSTSDSTCNVNLIWICKLADFLEIFYKRISVISILAPFKSKFGFLFFKQKFLVRLVLGRCTVRDRSIDDSGNEDISRRLMIINLVPIRHACPHVRPWWISFFLFCSGFISSGRIVGKCHWKRSRVSFA